MFAVIKGIVAGIKDTIINTIKNIITNIESVIILTFSAIGITSVLSTLPFTMTVPLWVESSITVPFVLPVVSIFTIAGLVTIMKYRMGLEGIS